jgi:hypothetical protein
MILPKIGDKIIKKINPAQCGFVKKKETLIQVASVLNRLKEKQQKIGQFCYFLISEQSSTP